MKINLQEIKMKNKINIFLLCLILFCGMFGLLGCLPYARSTKMTPEYISNVNKHAGSLLVTISGGRKVNRNWSRRISTEMISSAICDSMGNVFDSVQTLGDSDYQLHVTLLESERHGRWFGLGDETAYASINWKLTSKNGKLLWLQTTQGNSKYGIFEGVPTDERKRMANEAAIKENIRQAVQAIGQLSF